MKHWFKIALLNFLIAALLGVLLRFAFVVEVPWLKYRYFLHTHSHVAMLGWVYLAFYAMLIPAFLNEERARDPFYRRLFWLTQLSVLGMLFSFPFQGYGPVSITFSTAHVLFSYAFIYCFWKDLGKRSPEEQKGNSEALIKTAMGFMVLSTFGLWAMGPVIAFDLSGSVWYHLAVQFYLHFQFYGWFTFALFALIFRFMEVQEIPVPGLRFRRFHRLLIISVLLTYGLPVTWAFPETIFFVINGTGAVLQLIALILLIRLLHPHRKKTASLLPRWSLILTGFALSAWAMKVLIQSLTVVPVMATIGYTIRNFTIGFLHLLLLGVVSAFLIGYAFYRPGWLPRGRVAPIGAGFFLAGVLFSEILLFGQGFMLWGGVGFIPAYYELLFGVSLLMPAGIILLLLPERN